MNIWHSTSALFCYCILLLKHPIFRLYMMFHLNVGDDNDDVEALMRRGVTFYSKVIVTFLSDRFFFFSIHLERGRP